MKVSIIDEAFTGWTGHNAGYNFAIGEELSKRSIDCQVFAHQSLPDLPGAPVRVLPTFTQNTHAAWPGPRWLPPGLVRLLRLIVMNYRHGVDLVRKVTPRIRDDEIVLIVIESRYSSFAYGVWLLLLRLRRLRLTPIFVVHNVPSNILKSEMRFVRALARGHHVVLAAHTAAIARLCEDATGQRCHLLPLPFLRAESGPRRITAGDRAVTFTYLGVASAAKGFDLVAHAIDDIEDLLASGAVRLTIQCNTYQSAEDLAELRSAVVARARATQGIRVVGELSAEDYGREMEHADVILIPNRPEFYEHALSGVFAEALAKGKPVIVSEGTYMAKELAEHGSGLTFQRGSATALAQAVRTAAARIAVLGEQASAARTAWLAWHNPRQYVDIVLGLWSEGAST